MNILLLCDEYPPCKHGGIGTVTQKLARELVKLNNKVFVIGLYPYYRVALESEVDNGVVVRRLFYGNKISLRVSRSSIAGRFYNVINEFNKYVEFIKNFIEKEKIEIVEIPDFNEIFRYTGVKFIEFGDFGIPKIIKLHGTYTQDSLNRSPFSYNKDIFRKEKNHIIKSDRIVAVSLFTRDQVKEIFNIPCDISVIYNGVHIDNLFRFSMSDSKDVVFMGRISREKGVYRLVKAWTEIIKHYPDARLFLYGNGSEKVIKEVKKLVNRSVLETIKFKGFVEKSVIHEHLSKSACFILPSYIESFSLAPLEAMGIGCPTIFTKRASGSELIENWENGILVDPDNEKEISNAIIFILENKDKANYFGMNGFKTINNRFNITDIASQTLLLYADTIARYSRSNNS